MNKDQLRRALDQVQVGRLSRRAFIEQMARLGIAAPLTCQMLASAGIAAAQTPTPFVPAKRGGGGALKVLMWQATTMLHPSLAVGGKDWDASRMFYEPLASFDSAGDLVPVLAREVPTVQNGGVAKDGTSVTWKLKPDVRWHDGVKFTADDVVFTAQYISDPATGSPQSLRFREVERVEALDPTTVKVSFKQPMPFPWGVFCGLIMTIPKHVFEPYKGTSREKPRRI